MALKGTQNRTIVFDISEAIYESFMGDSQIAHYLIREAVRHHPELFSPQMTDGYVLLAVTQHTELLTSPAARLNGFVYHQDWLENLLIAASMGDYRHQRKTL